MNRKQILLKKTNHAILAWHAINAFGFLAIVFQLIGLRVAQNYLQIAISCALYLSFSFYWMRCLRQANWYIHKLVELRTEIETTSP